MGRECRLPTPERARPFVPARTLSADGEQHNSGFKSAMLGSLRQCLVAVLPFSKGTFGLGGAVFAEHVYMSESVGVGNFSMTVTGLTQRTCSCIACMKWGHILTPSTYSMLDCISPVCL